MRKVWLVGGAAVLALSVPLIAAEMDMGKTIARSDVKEHFAKLDANHDGAITMEEIHATHDKMRDDWRDRHFKMLDANGDGSISRAEFDAQHAGGREGMAGMDHGPDHGPDKGAMDDEHGGKGHGEGHKMGGGMLGMKMFARADANKDGKVTLEEATAGALALFDAADTNHDGSVTPDEHHAFHDKMHAQMGTADKAH
jgi:EF-hand domain pair/EF hand